MASISARRMRSACVVSAVAVGALVAPSLASAKKTEPPQQCSGVQTLEAAGSTFQKTAQVSVWAPNFNAPTDTNPAACSGTQGSKQTPKISYKSIGSTQGMEEFGLNGHAFDAATVGIATTDEPPNAAQKAEIETHGTASALDTIPVLQSSVAIVMHLPTGCTGTSGPAPGRLVISNATLNGIFTGAIKKWGGIKDGGDTITPSTCNETPFKVVVRRDGSGTTHITKKYFSLISTAKVETEKGELKNWTEIDEGTENTTWPKLTEVVRETGEGGGNLAKTVAETPSTIGYAALPDARGKGFAPPAAGAGKELFWVEVENAPVKGKAAAKYADPSDDKETSATATIANCTGEKYTNGEGKAFPPKTVAEPWNEVTTSLKQTNYTICGLTYDLVFANYEKYGLAVEEATTVRNYLAFEIALGAGGGQTLIQENHDYLELGSKLTGIARKGVEKIA